MKNFICELILSCVVAAPVGKPVDEFTYGTMLYSYENVVVTSIAMGNDGHREIFAGETNLEDVNQIVGADLTLDMNIHDRSTTSATMVDCLPTMAMYTQIFHDQLTLRCGDEVYMKGNPLKASLRWLNPFRVVNANMPFSFWRNSFP